MEKTWKGLYALCILVLLAGGASPSHAYQQDLKKLAGELATKVRAKNLNRVTVVDFLDLDKQPNKLGQFLAQQLQVTLTEPEHGLEVVDQNHLPRLFDQVEMSSEGLLDPATSRQLGKIAGTEVIVVGTVTPSSLTIKLDVQAIDLQTARVITGETSSLARLGLLQRLASESASGGAEVASGSADEAAAPAKAQSPKGKSPSSRSRHDQGMSFDLHGCSLSGNALTCALTVTSDRDRWFCVSFGSRAWNEAGEEYGPRDITIANSRSDRSYAAKQVLKGVPTRLALTFPDFGDEERAVERLRLFWEEAAAYCNRNSAVEFEKVTLSDDTDFSSTRAAGDSGGGGGGAAEKQGKRHKGVFGRIGARVTEAVESAAADIVEKKTREMVGGEKEKESEDPPQDKR